MTQSYAISPKLHLIHQPLAKEKPATPVELPINHVFVVDCSGSMCADLPKIQEQLKRKLPKLLKDNDSISVIWFSGVGQCGTLLEGERIASLLDLRDVENALSKLRPVGLTAFQQPIHLAKDVLDRVTKKYPEAIGNLIFLSDGYDNCGSRAKILEAMTEAGPLFASTTIVEYGFYADRALLANMAERAGGAHIFAEDFDRYAPSFESAIQKRATGAKRVTVAITGDPIGGFCFALPDGEITAYGLNKGAALVPEDVTGLWYLSPAPVGSTAANDLTQRAAVAGHKPQTLADPAITAAYAAVSLFSVRMKPDIVYPLLGALGDARLIRSFASCFGKQRYSAFQETVTKAAFGEGRYLEGYDPDLVPADDAFTVLELLHALSLDPENRVLLDHPEFQYNRISRGRVNADEHLSADEQQEKQALLSELDATSSIARVGEIGDRLKKLAESRPVPLRFVPDPAPDGYSVTNLVMKEDRPNVSIQTRKTGYVDIGARKPATLALPSILPTFIYRNYAIIKDGLVNVEKLPVRLTPSTVADLTKRLGPDTPKVLTNAGADRTFTLDLRSLPVINRKMVSCIRAERFFRTKYNLLVAQAEQKVFKYYQDQLLPEKADGIADQFGEAETEWLSSIGITAHGGFAPKAVVAPSTDFYIGKKLQVNLKGFSKLPPVKDVKEALASKRKLSAAANLMVPAVKLVEDFLASHAYQNAADGGTVFETWLRAETKDSQTRARDLLHQIAEMTFSLIVSQTWFSEFDSPDNAAYDLKLDDGSVVHCEASMKDEEVKI